ncbi:hypothetical protein HU200_034571 [Digitaria exilis]|uniref:KIB1-4 beta-propeller domain-containing protein n=1 Tax=Digitaria exilis TaxID=1010633 RepID=A0A835BJT7_9POAL|nr:hypothetical protein HU200_034571 [Digitaria exilis]
MKEVPSCRPPTSWSDIRLELAVMVLGRLPAHVDRVWFAAVCPQWRAAARQGGLPPPMPLLLLPDATVYSLPGRGPFHFPSCAGYTDTCGDWLVFSGEDGCFLKNPFSNATVMLPPLSRIRFQHVGGESVNVVAGAWMEIYQREELVASKIMFLLASPRRSNNQGKLYSLGCMDTLLAVDVSVDPTTGDPSVSQIQTVVSGILACGAAHLMVRYLVESHGAVLVVCRMIDQRLEPGQWDRIEDVAAEQNCFEVYEANFEQSRWAKVTTLGDDHVLFLCQRWCRSVSISYNEMPGDRIFFMDTDEEYYLCYSKEASSSCRVYDMRDGKVSTPLPLMSWKLGKVFATWLLPPGLN